MLSKDNQRFTSTSIPQNLKDKSQDIKELFLKVANEGYSKGMNISQSIAAGIKAVSEKEQTQKVQQQLTKSTSVVSLQDKLKANISQTLKDQYYEEEDFEEEDTEEISKAETPFVVPTVVAAEFDKQGHLVILMSDGRRVVTKGKAVEQHIEQSVGVSINPVFDHVQMNTTAGYTAEDYVPGMLTWNAFEDCLDVVQADGSILQVGLEQYIPVINKTTETLPNGSVVRFSGVSLEETPECLPLIADGSIAPLYLIGVLTNELAAGQRGRATIFGKVRNLNTTGSDVGEVWQPGTLLWAHPTIAGRLTSIQPTAPDVVISVASVLKADATEGVLLVRPTIFPRLFYGVFSSLVTQTPAAANTPYAVTFETTEIASGVRVVDNRKITTDNAGLYSFDFRLQLTSSNSSQKSVYIWARKNGVNIPNSNSKITISGNGVELVPSWSFTVSTQVGDYFELMYAVSDTAVSIDAPAATSFAPSTPAATLRVSQINL